MEEKWKSKKAMIAEPANNSQKKKRFWSTDFTYSCPICKDISNENGLQNVFLYRLFEYYQQNYSICENDESEFHA